MANEIMGACAPVTFMTMGMIDNNVYIIDDGEGCIVVDPSCDADTILEALGGKPLDAIIVTHAHWDHVGALRELRASTGAEVIASRVETPYVNGEKSFDAHSVDVEPCEVDRMVEDGDVLEYGNLALQVIATPGHTPGGICVFIEPDDASAGVPLLVSGDTLFAGTHGRVDFPEGDIRAMQDSLARLSALPPETIVLPGHNGLTTIGREVGWLRLCCY